MPTKYERKLLDDGTPNPRYRLRSRVKDWHPRFTAIDGEGYTDDDGKHHYVYLASSSGKSISNFWNGNTLGTVKCFEFLLNEVVKGHYLVCYGASYDVNMMLVDVPIDKLKILHEDGYVYWKDYGIRYIPRKLLQITRYEGVGGNRKTATLYDVFGFFQSKFTTALEQWLGKDNSEIETIKAGKELRSQFTLADAEYITDYCGLELKMLVKLMDKLAEHLKTAGIHVSSWIGAGAIASKLLETHHIKQHIVPTVFDDKIVYDSARYAYAGGRIELLKYGHTEEALYHYDINSAYVAAIPHLPSLMGLQWYWHPYKLGMRIPDFSIVSVRYQAKHAQPFYPFFWRTTDGRIYYPRSVESRYWGVEVNAVLKHNPTDIQQIFGFFCYKGDPEYPFDWVEKLYDVRKNWKNEGNPAHVVLKLGLNSLYGKFVQHVGADKETRKLPAFHQLEWAGFITAFTRAKMYDAAMQKPDAIVSFQTDGIFSTEPLKLDIGDGLGQWSEEAICESGTFVQSGVYFVKEKDGKRLNCYRGFDEGTLSEDRVLAGWRQGESTIHAESTRFVTLGGALSNSSFFVNWRHWKTIDRELQLYPDGTKRQRDDSCEPWKQLCTTDTNDYFNEKDYRQYPYSLPWDHWMPTDELKIDGIEQKDYLDEYDESNA